MLPLTAILVASEAMAASKQPQRSHLASELNSVTSITHVTLSIWPLKAFMRQMTRGDLSSIDERWLRPLVKIGLVAPLVAKSNNLDT